jgi:hypothetical protein
MRPTAFTFSVVLVSVFSILLLAVPGEAQRGRRGRRVETARRDRYVPPPPRWSPPPPLVDLRTAFAACERAFVGSVNERRCMDLVSSARVPYDPSSTIDACERSFVGDENALACLGAALPARYDATSSIYACERAFVGDANALSCVQRVVSGRVAEGAIDACERAFVGDDAALQCLDAVAGSRYEPVQLIEYCGSQYDALTCMRSMR